MPQIKNCSLDINLNTELKGILDAANFGKHGLEKFRCLPIIFKR